MKVKRFSLPVGKIFKSWSIYKTSEVMLLPDAISTLVICMGRNGRSYPGTGVAFGTSGWFAAWNMLNWVNWFSWYRLLKAWLKQKTKAWRHELFTAKVERGRSVLLGEGMASLSLFRFVLGVLDSVLTLCDRERQKLSRWGKRKPEYKDIHTFRCETEMVLERTEARFFESLPQLVAAESFQC